MVPSISTWVGFTQSALFLKSLIRPPCPLIKKRICARGQKSGAVCNAHEQLYHIRRDVRLVFCYIGEVRNTTIDESRVFDVLDKDEGGIVTTIRNIFTSTPAALTPSKERKS